MALLLVPQDLLDTAGDAFSITATTDDNDVASDMFHVQLQDVHWFTGRVGESDSRRILPTTQLFFPLPFPWGDVSLYRVSCAASAVAY